MHSKQDVQMHTQNTDSHIWRSLSFNSSRTNCVVYRIGSIASLATTGFLTNKKCQVYIQSRHIMLAELLRLWGYCQTIIARPRTPMHFSCQSDRDKPLYKLRCSSSQPPVLPLWWQAFSVLTQSGTTVKVNLKLTNIYHACLYTYTATTHAF